ncbi:MAG: aminotransferase class III-fold pyridoxal phosphate-dependent enzyme [Mucinivorans sp.]
MKLFNVYHLLDVEIVRAQGSTLWDKNGKEYLDFYGGHAVISIGHTNPRYVKAINDQLSKIGFYSNSVVISAQEELAELLGQLSGKKDYQLFMCNSGAEANENALKLASFHTGRRKVIAFSGSFHGRTSLAVAATDNPKIVAPINETPNVIFSKFNDVEALRELFDQNGDQIAAVITEGIQGVGGVQEASPEFLRAIRELTSRHGALYIADSVQCGCGRSGSYFSHDWAGVDADIYTMAKGIANGFPLGALLISPSIKPAFGMLGTTFGGNHLACAAAKAVAREMLDYKLIENAKQMGDYLLFELKKLASNKIKEIRGRGLMIGIEFNEDCTPIRSALLKKHSIFVGSAANACVIRLLPTLNITKKECDLVLLALKSELFT